MIVDCDARETRRADRRSSGAPKAPISILFLFIYARNGRPKPGSTGAVGYSLTNTGFVSEIIPVKTEIAGRDRLIEKQLPEFEVSK